MKEEKTKSSACLFAGIGCAILVALGVAAVGGLSFWGWQKSKELKDPQAQAEAVKKILGADTLPESYNAVFGLKVPWVMDVAFLSDRAITIADTDGNLDFADLGDRAFVYFRFLQEENDDPKLGDFFEGRSDDSRVLRRHGVDIDLDVDQILGRGVVEVDGGEAVYVATEGSLEADDGDSEGLTTISLIRCAGDRRLRVALWETPKPEAGPEAEPASLAGTPADPVTLQTFLGHFSLCS